MKVKLGGTRFILIFKNFVIKIPYPLWRRGMYGILSNIEETYKWKNFKHFRNIYAPVLFCFPLGLFLIMKRADPINPNDRIEYFLHCQIKEDVYWGNVGILNGKQVLIDYGVRPIRRKNTLTKILRKLRYRDANHIE